jgi:hypothetical protein
MTQSYRKKKIQKVFITFVQNYEIMNNFAL